MLSVGHTYFHGTCKAIDADTLLREGIRPPPPTGKGFLAPVPGRVYLTRHLSYALIYTIGANAVGGHWAPNSQKPDAEGLLFSVDSDKLSGLQPDEDCVGALIPALGRPDGLEPSKYSPWEDELHANLKGDPAFCSHVSHFLRYAVTEGQHKRAMDGFIAHQAATGKRALKTMPESMKAKLVEYGCQVAHEGTVHPDQCWVMPLRDNRLLHERTGENFFEIAKSVHGAPSKPEPTYLPAPAFSLAAEHSSPFASPHL